MVDLFGAVLVGAVVGIVVEVVTGVGGRLWEHFFPPQPTKVELIPPTPAVGWQVEHVKDRRYRLRNTGNETARQVTILDSRLPQGVLSRDLPNDVTLAAGESHPFLLMPTAARPLPGEIWVEWDGGTVAVPLP